MECTYCGEELDDEETASPEKDDDGDVMCDDCYQEHFMDTCERCQNLVDDKTLVSPPGALITVWREAEGSPDDLTPGYYRVKEWPFYADEMIEGHMISSALQKVGELSERDAKAAPEAWTACPPLCSECRAEIEAQIKTPNEQGQRRP